MDKLWSPWRSKYIESFSMEKKEEGCIFCNQQLIDINSKENLIVYKGKNTFVILNLYPYNSGHLMVIPYRHTNDFLSLNAEESLEIMQNLQLSIKALQTAMHPNGFNVGANVGKSAGAGIDQHLHFHIVPRWTGDINFMPVIGEVKVLSQDLLETKEKLISAFEKLKTENI
ncbi:MAG: HIT domain-containing protein [Ignavibacteria bacterium]